MQALAGGRSWGRPVWVGVISLALLLLPTVTAQATAPVAGARTAAVTAAAATPSSPALVTTNPSDATPFATDGQVQALAQAGNRIIAGGTFTTVKNANTSLAITQPYLFAYDRVTQRVDTAFAPVLNGEVQTLQVTSDGAGILVGGRFKTVGGVTQSYLARLDVATGALVTSFAPLVNGPVSDVSLVAGKLYLTGWFTKVGGKARAGLAAVAETTGTVDPNLTLALATTRGTSGVRTVNVTPDGRRMVVGGNFSSVGGVARSQVAVIDLTTAVPAVRADWATSTFAFTCTTGCTRDSIYTYIRDIDLSADGTYFIVGTTFYLPGNGDSLSRFEVNATGTAIAPTWIHYTGTDTITTVLISPQGPVYIGGHFRWYGVPQNCCALAGQVTRYGLAAVSPSTGMPYDWSPTRERGYGVLAMLITTDGDLVIGHDTNTVGGERHPRLAMFPLATGRAAAQQATVLPAAVTMIKADQTSLIRTWSGTAVTGSQAVQYPLPATLRGGFALGNGVVVATASGLFFYVPDAYGRWILQSRLAAEGLTTGSITGMAFAGETLYYTLGDGKLYARAMNSDSMLIDPFAQVLSGPSTASPQDWTSVRGLFAAGGSLWASTSAGELFRFGLTAAGGVTTPGTRVSGPLADGQNWTAAALVGSAAAVPAVYRPNLALRRVATQSSTDGGSASRAVDGNRDGLWSVGSTTQTQAVTPTAPTWWQVDLGSSQPITGVALWNRQDCCQERLANVSVFLSDTPFTSTSMSATAAQAGVTTVKYSGIAGYGSELAAGRSARYVRVQVAGIESSPLSISEVEVYGAPATAPALAAR